ncbi:MAG: EpsG family protein [Muribaculaceae bacterium]|nr:EpsG family protein [Muribaculaceae bacterium]
MVSPEIYFGVYIFAVSVLTLFCIYTYTQYPTRRVLKSNINGEYVIPATITILLILYIGFRPLSRIFVDMMNYNETFNYITNSGEYFELDGGSTNFIFDNLFNYLATNYYEVVVLFVIIATLYFGCLYWSLKKIFPNDLLYALVVYLGALSTFAYGTNGIKAGAAASIFLLVFAFYKKPIIAAIFAIISLGFHHSMTVVIYAFILAYFIRNPKWFLFGWLFCLFIAALHFDWLTGFLAEFADDQSASRYLLADEDAWGGKLGFRWDFIVYSLPPILIGIWTIYKHKVIDRLYQLLLCTYLATNGFWLLCIYVPFNNRIAYLSWFLLPIVSIYPFLKLRLRTRQYIQLNYVAGFYLAFTVLSYIFL